jgi:hypothetical protein
MVKDGQGHQVLVQLILVVLLGVVVILQELITKLLLVVKESL